MNKYDLYYQVAHSHLQEQDTRNQQLEFKASAAIGLSATMLGLAGLTVAHWTSWSIFPAVAMLVAFLVAAGTSMPVLWTKDFERSPKLEELCKYLPDYEDDVLKSWTANAFSASVDHNDELLDGKAGWLKKSLLGIMSQGLFLGLLILSTNPELVSTLVTSW